ncbi:MAG TPA: acyl-CoA dehydrogenase family protein [Acidimicrobiia bacterium]|nr:acyl-CoA dehydrogenase family protein [Acidimicrobiia bacterium]
MTAIARDTDLVAAARALAPLIESEADAAELAGTMTVPVVQALHEAGLFGLMIPTALGGSEASILAVLEVFEELSRADGSTGWSHMANATAMSMAAVFTSDDACAAIFADAATRMPAIAGMFAPQGSAELGDDGNYVFTGRYGFASGSGHAAWISGGALVVHKGEFVARADGMPEMRVAFVPRDQVEFLDNWDVLGLQGTGSYDYALHDVAVEAGFTFPLLDAVAHRGGPVYGLSVLGITAAGHAGFALGVGKRGLEEVVRIVAGKARLGASPVRDQQLFQYELGLHDAAMRAARAVVFESFGEVEANLRDGREPGPEKRGRLRQVTTYATRVAAEAVRFAYTWAGSDALRQPSVLGRCFRDMHAGTQHLFVDNNTLSDAGALLLAGPSSAPAD